MGLRDTVAEGEAAQIIDQQYGEPVSRNEKANEMDVKAQ